MNRCGLLVPFAALTLTAAVPRGRMTYLYTYYDRQGHLVINNLPPSFVRGRGLVLKHVGVGRVRLAVTPAEMSKVLRSPELIALVDRIAKSQGVDIYLARAIIQAESAFDYRARSRAGALGLMQLMPSTAERFGVLDPFDPRQNIEGGVKYLHWLEGYYKGDLTKVVAAYNAGEHAVDRYHGIPPYGETRAYVPKVLDLYRRHAVQPDPHLAGSMALLKKGRGGFLVDVARRAAAPSAPAPVEASTPIYQWVDAHGRLQITDQPPPRGARSVKVTGGS